MKIVKLIFNILYKIVVVFLLLLIYSQVYKANNDIIRINNKAEQVYSHMEFMDSIHYANCAFEGLNVTIE